MGRVMSSALRYDSSVQVTLVEYLSPTADAVSGNGSPGRPLFREACFVAGGPGQVSRKVQFGEWNDGLVLREPGWIKMTFLEPRTLSPHEIVGCIFLVEMREG